MPLVSSDIDRITRVKGRDLTQSYDKNVKYKRTDALSLWQPLKAPKPPENPKQQRHPCHDYTVKQCKDDYYKIRMD